MTGLAHLRAAGPVVLCCVAV